MKRKALHVDARRRARDGGRRREGRDAARGVARGAVGMGKAAFEALSSGRLAKGDAMAVARLAGIQAAKRTSEIIPLCHPLALESVEVDVALVRARREAVVTATARITGKTGVEMEALTAVAAACLAHLRHGQGPGSGGGDPGDRPAREVGRPLGRLSEGVTAVRYRYLTATSSPIAPSAATRSPSCPTPGACRRRGCSRSPASSTSPRAPSCCRPKPATRAGCGSSRRRWRCPSPGIRTSGRRSPWPGAGELGPLDRRCGDLRGEGRGWCEVTIERGDGGVVRCEVAAPERLSLGVGADAATAAAAVSLSPGDVVTRSASAAGGLGGPAVPLRASSRPRRARARAA